MASAPEIAAGQAEAFALAARDSIDARLGRLPDGELADYWAIVAKVYARGIEQPEEGRQAEEGRSNVGS